SVDDRQAAAWALGRFGTAGAISPLCELLEEANPSLAHAGWQGLLDLGDRRAVPCLLRMLRRADSSELRKWMIYALGWLGDERAVPHLIRVLEADGDDTDVRAMAAEQLGRLESAASIASLVAALHSPHADVRFWSAYSLGR